MHSFIRAGYVHNVARKTVTVRRKDGTTYRYVRKAGKRKVRSVPTKDVGAIGKPTSVIGKLKAGMLTKYHYHPVEARTNRHKALVSAVTKGHEEPHAIIRRLTAISTLTKRTLPRASSIYKQDAKWIHAKYSKMFGRKKY